MSAKRLRARRPGLAGTALGMPAPEVMEREAARYVLAVAGGTVPETCPPWMPGAIATACFAQTVTICEADGLEGQAAEDAARLMLAAIAEGMS